MKRKDLWNNYQFEAPDNKKRRVIVDSDVKNEADDQYAIIHHLMTPTIEVKGIVAAHFEERSREIPEQAGKSMELSFQELTYLMQLSGVDDVPIFRGAPDILTTDPQGEGIDFIIQEALREDERPLYVACQGCLTDVAAAYKKAPEIAEKVIVIWIGGGAYPKGGMEFNLSQDIEAARVVMQSPMEVWQIPVNVYRTVEVSFAELQNRVAGCGKIGEYLFRELTETSDFICGLGFTHWPQGETWCLGDSPTVGVLLQAPNRECFHMEDAPGIADDMTYLPGDGKKKIRVYDSVDTRLLMEDFFWKMKLCFGN